MSLDETIFLTDFQQVINDLPAVITYKTQQITGTATDTGNGATLAIEGVYADVDFSFFGKVSDFSTAPQPGEKFTYQSTEYRILKVTKDCAGVVYRLDAESANKK